MRIEALLLLSLLLVLPSVSAAHMTLLTVADDGEKWDGGTADLFLEVHRGSGRIFIDSFPISRLDTQFSTRYANEIACDFLDIDCDRYDFFYTIRADSSVVGGPSAGAAIAILTIAALDKQPVNPDVAITGTINSGGLIGPVAGIIPKAMAAKDAGLEKVLIPSLTPLAVEEMRAQEPNATDENRSLNYSESYDEEVIASLSDENFTVIQTDDLYAALPYFIAKPYPEPEFQFSVDPSYSHIMEEVAGVLCSRRDGLLEELAPVIAVNGTLANMTSEMDERIAMATERQDFYSVASFCFGQNIDLKTLTLDDNQEEELRSLRRAIRLTEERAAAEPLETIGDVETYAIVRERLVEAKEIFDDQNITKHELAYAIERAFSAQVWSAFFSMESEAYVVDENLLRDACLNKMGEAEERVAYVESYLPQALTAQGRDELTLAHRDQRQGEYALCLFKASKAKAEANILASALSISEPRLKSLVARKLRAAERVLSEQAEDGRFPIMGYSYYEYAQNLEEQPYSALTFAEYALELSQLNLYFPQHQPWYQTIVRQLPIEEILIFVVGFFTGILMLFLILRKER